MIALLKPYFYTNEASIVNVDLRRLIEHPIIRDDKFHAPLWCFCNLHDSVSVNDGHILAVADNIKEYNCIQLDYDSGKGMDEFVKEFSDKFMFAAYSSFSYGYKEGDRFRVIIPLKTPFPQTEMGFDFKKAMVTTFEGCDPSCFDRCHLQACPCIREEGAPYKYYFNRIKKYFEPPYGLIKSLHERSSNIAAFDEAVAHCINEYCPQDELDYSPIVKWAQDKIDFMVEGTRNTTMFGVVGFMKRKGVPLEAAMSIDVPAECVHEWNGMLKRIYM